MTRPADQVITLQSKLTPPRLKNTLQRKRLLPLFEDIENHKAVTVTAGAGYGKTICVAQACRAGGVPTVWYRLDPTDGDLPVFLSYLVAGIRQHYPEFGRQTVTLMHAIEEQFQSEKQDIMPLFLHELETTLEQRLVIVLDDFHLIHDNPEIGDTLNFLLQRLPEQLYFIIISRTPPRLDLSRMVAARQLFAISENDLMFNRVEIADLYHHIFGITLPDDALESLAQKTGGWAVGLILFHYALKDRNRLSRDIRPQLSMLNGNYGFFSEYLEENLFKILPEKIGSFLLQSAILPVLDVGFCNRLLKIDDAGEILDHLEKMHLFTSAVDRAGQTYQYHQLFRDYLRARLQKAYDADAVAGLHVTAAAICQSENDIHQAIEHYLTAGAYDNAVALMVAHGEEMIETGMVNQIMTHCRQLPNRFIECEPWLQLLLGKALLNKGRTRESLEVIETARHQFRQKGDQAAEGRCITILGSIYVVLNQFSKAESTYKALLERKGITPDTYALSVSTLIFISSRLDKPEQVEHYYQKAAPLLDRTDQPLWSVWIHGFYGFSRLACAQFNEAIYHGQQAEKEARRLNKYRQVTLCCHLIAAAFYELGEFEKGYQKALEGILLSEKFGFQGPSYAWCHISAALSAAGLGLHQEALKLGRKGLQISVAADSGWTSAHAHVAVAVAQAQMADYESAESECRQALTVINQTALELDQAMIHAFLAWLLLARDRMDEALSFMRAAEAYHLSNFKFKRWNLLFYCALDVKQADMASARDRLVSVLEYLPQAGKDRLMLEHQFWVTPLLVMVYAEGKCCHQVETLLARFSSDHVEAIKDLQYSDDEKVRTAAKTLTGILNLETNQDLKVLSFGRFRLFKGDTEIETQQWTSAKARLLFKYLTFHSRQGYVTKDKLLEMLWPDQDPEVTTKRLHVALTTIRKMLEPDLPRGARSSYLLRDLESYRLDLGDNGYSDVAAFDDALARAEDSRDPNKAIRGLLEAHSLYTGSFLEEEAYTEWCMEVRETYQDKFKALLLMIADHYRQSGDSKKQIDFLQQVLTIDEYAEEIYCRLMILYNATGNRFMVLKTWKQCKQKIEVDLDCPLSNDTRKVFNTLISA